jgi:hypothetical protein
LASGVCLSQTIFNPIFNAPTTLSATSTSSNGVMANAVSEGQVRVFNTCSAIAFVKFGNSSGLTASTSDIPLAPNSIEIFSVSTSYSYASVVLAAGGPCDVSFLRGAGL